jgi:hypothetical protein
MLIAVKESKSLLESGKHFMVNKHLFLLTMKLWSDRTLKLATYLLANSRHSLYSAIDIATTAKPGSIEENHIDAEQL